MKITLQLVACLAFITAIWACERPKSPDFSLEHTVQAPLTVEKTYRFLGKEAALIDSTSENFESLFTTDPDGLVRPSLFPAAGRSAAGGLNAGQR